MPQTEPLKRGEHPNSVANLHRGMASSVDRGPDGRIKRRVPTWDVTYNPSRQGAALVLRGVEAEDEAEALRRVIDWIASRPGDLEFAQGVETAFGQVVVVPAGTSL
jgi:hypothetical protein